MDDLENTYVIAEDQDEAKVLEKINMALKDCDAENGVFSFQLPSRGYEKAYEYNLDLQQICLRKGKTYICSINSKRHSKKAMRIGTLLLLIKKLITEHESIRFRWVYYLNPNIYTNQDASDAAVAATSLMFEATRSSFHITPSPRGSIIGSVLLCVQDQIIVNCTLGAVSGSKIPSEAEKIDMIVQVARVDFILSVEKETIFHRLSDMDFHKKKNCVILTASGEPDVATRIILKKFRIWLDVPVFALVDANPLICCAPTSLDRCIVL
ncbi:hypothetical protein BS78_05G054000 [Paspalum vaginatum]|nr:hypothetical protein BS78_05G054000 [Paspalum vaginatum]